MANYDLYDRSVTTDQGTAVPPGGVISGSSGGAQTLVLTVAAGAGGAADDVTIFSSSLPAKTWIVDSVFKCTTTIGGGTVTLRTAAAGGGTALSSAIVAATPSTARDLITTGVPAALAAGTSMFLRRSDSAIAGTLVIHFVLAQ